MTDVVAASEGDLLWQPSAGRAARSNLRRYMSFLASERGLDFQSYQELWRWSVTDIEAFWRSIWDYFRVVAHEQPSRVLSGHEMPGAHWFDWATLNYAEHALRRDDAHPAVIYRSEDGKRIELSYSQLRDRVARARAGFRRMGIVRGDRVASFLPNTPETLIAFLAAASLGAVWSSCSPEFGVGSVLDRFSQIEPKVLLATDGYVYGGKRFNRMSAVREIQSNLPSLTHTVLLYRHEGTLVDTFISWPELCAREEPLEFEPVSFEHPLWILYSSGTTGLPKPIVQGHGGIVLEHLKSLALHCDLGPEDRFFWFTTTGWMMWNFLVSGLLLGCTVMLYEGNPGFPDMNALWKFADEERVSYFGTSAPYLMACRKAGVVPKEKVSLDALKSVGSTGAPLPVEGFSWVYENVARDVLLGSVSGGTDLCTAFVTSCPLLPVHAGELQCSALGAKVEAFDANGRPVLGQVGELVITEPMPSMPLYLLNDPDGELLRASYFEKFPGIWRHGDWIKITERGSSVIYGRSDSTLNRGGVRIGTAEFYRVVEELPEVSDSLVVDTGSLSSEGELWLFVVPGVHTTWSEAAAKRIRTVLRQKMSPRHVPDHVVTVRQVPRTINGKKLEVPIKRILTGATPDSALNEDTLANPSSVGELLDAVEQVRGVSKGALRGGGQS